MMKHKERGNKAEHCFNTLSVQVRDILSLVTLLFERIRDQLFLTLQIV